MIIAVRQIVVRKEDIESVRWQFPKIIASFWLHTMRMIYLCAMIKLHAMVLRRVGIVVQVEVAVLNAQQTILLCVMT